MQRRGPDDTGRPWPDLVKGAAVALAVMAVGWLAVDWANPCTGQITDFMGCLAATVEPAPPPVPAGPPPTRMSAEERAARHAAVRASQARYIYDLCQEFPNDQPCNPDPQMCAEFPGDLECNPAEIRRWGEMPLADYCAAVVYDETNCGPAP